MNSSEVRDLLEETLKKELTCVNNPLAVLIVAGSKYVLGWNGSPTCIVNGECINRDKPFPGIEALCHPVHAEIRAIAEAARIGLSLQNSAIYMSGWFPCAACAEAIVHAGIKKLVTPNKIYIEKNVLIPEFLGSELYRFEIAEKILVQGGVKIITDPDIRPRIS